MDDQSISEDDLFYKVYGILHSRGISRDVWQPTWRSRPLGFLCLKYARRLSVPSLCAGRELARLHIEYENVRTL